jgi:hypothetical protein
VGIFVPFGDDGSVFVSAVIPLVVEPSEVHIGVRVGRLFGNVYVGARKFIYYYRHSILHFGVFGGDFDKYCGNCVLFCRLRGSQLFRSCRPFVSTKVQFAFNIHHFDRFDVQNDNNFHHLASFYIPYLIAELAIV